MSKLLTIRDLKVSFPFFRGNTQVLLQAVKGVSFSLDRGEVLGIVGESGSGKSVSTTAIMGLLPEYAQVSGEILFDGIDILSLSKKDLRNLRGKKIGMIFQEPARSFDPLQNIGNVFFETLRNTHPKISREEAQEKTIALLQEVGLNQVHERLKSFPHQFSGGQLQRIGIALALAQGCELLIADEPTTALDVTIQAQIMSLLKKLQKDRKLSIIFISHNIDLVASISDRIMVMYGGLVMEENTTNSLMTAAQHPYTKALMASSPSFEMHYTTEKLSFIPGKVIEPTSSLVGCPFYSRCSCTRENCEQILPPLTLLSTGKIRCHRIQEGETL